MVWLYERQKQKQGLHITWQRERVCEIVWSDCDILLWSACTRSRYHHVVLNTRCKVGVGYTKGRNKMDGEMFGVSVSMTQSATWHTHVECLVWHVVCTRGRITKLCCACSGVTVLDGSLPKIEMLSLVLVTCRMLLFFPVCMIWSVVRHVYYTSRDMWFEFIWRRSETTGLWSPESKWREICYFILSSIY